MLTMQGKSPYDYARFGGNAHWDICDRLSRRGQIEGPHLRNIAPTEARPNRCDRSVPRRLISASPYAALPSPPCSNSTTRRPISQKVAVINALTLREQPHARTPPRPRSRGAGPHRQPAKSLVSSQRVHRVVDGKSIAILTALVAANGTAVQARSMKPSMRCSFFMDNPVPVLQIKAPP